MKLPGLTLGLRWLPVLLLFVPLSLHGQGRISYVLGEVDLLRGGRAMLADIGQELSAGDRVRTGSDGTAIIELRNGTQLKLRENTLLDLDQLEGGVEVELQQGSLFSRVERVVGRGYRVRTGPVVAGVRGTEFFVAYGRTVDEAPDVWLCVNDGAVEVAVEGSDESVVVNEGEGINVLASERITEPRFYPWTEGLNWNMSPEAGEVRDATDLDQAYSDLLDQDYD